MELKILAQDDDHVHVACKGGITMEHIYGDEDPLERVLGPAGYTNRVCLSLEDTPLIDSAGIGWLVRCHKRAMQNGGYFVVHSLSPAVQEVFQLVKLDTIVHVAADYNEARTHQAT